MRKGATRLPEFVVPELSDAAQSLLLAIGAAIVLGLVQLVRGWTKGEGTAKPVAATVVSATVADSQAIRELIAAVDHLRRIFDEGAERHHSDSLALRDLMERRMSLEREMIDVMRRSTSLPYDMQAALDKLRNVP